jgi:hypothetical protein
MFLQKIENLNLRSPDIHGIISHRSYKHFKNLIIEFL